MPLAFERYVVDTLVPSLARHDKPEIMLLTCMDYRYSHRIVDVMDDRGLRLKYDMFVLAGASLGGNAGEGSGANKVPSSWREALVSHIQAARTIGHPIRRLVILDHRQCGAYKHFLGLDWEYSLPNDEMAAHAAQVRKLATHLKTVFADLVIDAILLTREEDDELCVGC